MIFLDRILEMRSTFLYDFYLNSLEYCFLECDKSFFNFFINKIFMYNWKAKFSIKIYDAHF